MGRGEGGQDSRPNPKGTKVGRIGGRWRVRRWADLKVGKIRGRGRNEDEEDLKAWRQRRWGGFEGGSEGRGRETGIYSDSEKPVRGPGRRWLGGPDSKGLDEWLLLLF